ncbi:hypothetical protein HYX03_00210, partial [Candidatus Woesearchaeota archaeon]|nr:hypothetical protein [Candidatus Woesearchaeota archaeon]
DPAKRVNRPVKRNDEIRPIRSDLESTIKSVMGEAHDADFSKAWGIMQAVVGKAYEIDSEYKNSSIKLSKELSLEKRRELVHKYLAEAGVDFIQLNADIQRQRYPISIDNLPDGPFKTLLNYITTKSHEEAYKLATIHRHLTSVGKAKPTVVTKAFREHAGLDAISELAPPEEVFSKYNAALQIRQSEYTLKSPTDPYNRAVKSNPAPVVDNAITSTAKDYANQHKS